LVVAYCLENALADWDLNFVLMTKLFVWVLAYSMPSFIAF